MVSSNVYSVYRKWGKTYKNTGAVSINTVDSEDYKLFGLTSTLSLEKMFSNVIPQCFEHGCIIITGYIVP